APGRHMPAPAERRTDARPATRGDGTNKVPQPETRQTSTPGPFSLGAQSHAEALDAIGPSPRTEHPREARYLVARDQWPLASQPAGIAEPESQCPGRGAGSTRKCPVQRPPHAAGIGARAYSPGPNA